MPLCSEAAELSGEAADYRSDKVSIVLYKKILAQSFAVAFMTTSPFPYQVNQSTSAPRVEPPSTEPPLSANT